MTLITIEGIDGAGKSTLHADLGRRLADLSPLMTREPGGTEIGNTIRNLLKSKEHAPFSPYTEAFLFAADHAQHVHEIIRPELQKKRLIISDRYYDSRIAYQRVTLSGVCEDPIRFLKEMHAGWSILPTHTFLLILDSKLAYERSKHRGEMDRFEVIELLDQFQHVFLRLAEEDPSRFTLLDARHPFEKMAPFVEETIRSIHAQNSKTR